MMGRAMRVSVRKFGRGGPSTDPPGTSCLAETSGSSRCFQSLRVFPETPYLGVRTNSLGLRLIAPQIASKTARVLFRHTPTPNAISIGSARIDFHVACLPNNSRWAKTKNVLAEQVARINRLMLNIALAKCQFFQGPST